MLSIALCKQKRTSLLYSFSKWHLWNRTIPTTTYLRFIQRQGARSTLAACIETSTHSSFDLRPKQWPFASSYHTYSLNHAGTSSVPFVPCGCRSISSQINRLLASDKPLSEVDVKRQIEELAEKFMEARELLNDAVESKGTVYFEEDLQDAREAIKETLSTYEAFLNALSSEQRQNVLRTIGLKMEELKAHERSILEELKSD